MKVLDIINEIRNDLQKIDYVEFEVESIRESSRYDWYFYKNVPLYRTVNPTGLFKKLAKQRYKYPEISRFLSEKIFNLIRNHLPEDVKRLEREAEKLGLYVDVIGHITVKVPSREILEAIEELEKELQSQ